MCNKFEPSRKLSFLKSKCPQCQSGKLFIYNAYKLNGFMQTNKNCPVCNLHFEIEPGFFWGAMYVSYGITCTVMITLGLSILFISNGKADFWTYIIPIISSLILGSPLTYRYARVCMLYFFSPIRFNKEFINDDSESNYII